MRWDRPLETITLPRLTALFKEWEDIIMGYLLRQNIFHTVEEALWAWKFVLFHDLKFAQDGELDEEAIELVTYEALIGRIDLGDPVVRLMMGDLALKRYKKIELQYPFATNCGYVGLASHEAEPAIGDTVCLLFGGPTPFILRKEARRYHFIGACYLDAFMTIEVQNMVLAQGSLQTFDLK